MRFTFGVFLPLWISSALSACANVIGVPDYTYGTLDGGTVVQNVANGASGNGSGPTGAGTGNATGATGASSGGAAPNSGSTGSVATGGSTGSSAGSSTGTGVGPSGGTGSGTGGFTGASGATGATGSTSGSGGASAGTSSGTAGASTGATGTTGSSTGTSGGATGLTGASSGSGGGTASCTWPSSPNYNGNGSFTCYYFGQGTTQSSGAYKTACGYRGTEMGSGHGNNCGQAVSDVMDNVANSGLAKNTYFAAFPGDSSFSQVKNCGMCVLLSNGSKSVIATVVDECPISSNGPCATNGHLDLSMQAFNALGYGVGNPGNTTWKAVACPVTGNIQIVFNSAAQIYVQNVVFPVAKVTMGGSDAKQSQYGYWEVSGNAGGAQITLTDVEGHSVTGTVPGNGGDLGVQFPMPASCP